MHDLTFHSDQSYYYQHCSIVELLKAHNVSQSMSRKSNCLNNALMENLFGLLKQEMFYEKVFESYKALEKEIHEYVKFYNHNWIKTKLKGMSSVQYREHTLESA
ncbi:transposase [Salinicoccus hispanicus]|uniref:IS3 family transposase n=1 Tax=Salinicoccus hispanicus TaxID=157225 RepID=A0A6N8TXJ3_9STAP|nr:IS3 family transposase [Salinicoccus hispanicus]MXQ50393.1 IS3 family transposase [Salinicoccus hispanicus]